MIPRKDVHTGIRTTTASKRKYCRAAAREGLRLSEWLRRVADGAIAVQGGKPRVCGQRAGTVALDAEEAVLGALLLDEAAFNVVAAIVEPRDFGGVDRRRIYEAVIRLRGASSAIDPITLAEELDGQGFLKAVGGREYIGTLLFAVPTAANVEYHAKIVKERARRRRLERLGTELP